MTGQEEDGLPHHGEVEADQGEAGDEVEREPVPAQHGRPALLGDQLPGALGPPWCLWAPSQMLPSK